MPSVKDSCAFSLQKLAVCVNVCDQYVAGHVVKEDCIRPAQEVVAACKRVIEACREHLEKCSDDTCIEACKACMVTAEKAVEKNTACVDACSGMGSDDDCKIVCKDCADACRACMEACQDCVDQVCS